MKILHVVDMISQYKAGGSAKVPYQLSNAQSRMGHEVTIYTSDYDAEYQKAPPGVDLVKFHCVLNLLGGIRLAPSMMFADFKNYDIVHLHNYRTFVNIIAANKGVPVVLQSHGSNGQMKGLTKPIHNLVWRNLIFNKASAYIADAEIEIDHYIAEGATKEDIHLVPVGIDFKEFSQAKQQVDKTTKRVLFLGRLHEIKAPDLLVRAFALMKRNDARLIISGIDYGMETTLRQLVSYLAIEDKVDWIGPQYGAAKVDAYSGADVYVMPSRYEMFGLTLLESLACGTPVVITDRCGIAPLLPAECGAVVPFDLISLAQAIKTSLNNNMASKHRSYRQMWARQYDWMKLAPRIIEIYEKVLGGELK